jgi:CelD/BcsL family acetyltransferase involved in cellulose biosynthesis
MDRVYLSLVDWCLAEDEKVSPPSRCMQAKVCGTHLVALPHSGVRPAHRFIRHVTPAHSDGSLALSHGEA